jgi:hypothetical protein
MENSDEQSRIFPGILKSQNILKIKTTGAAKYLLLIFRDGKNNNLLVWSILAKFSCFNCMSFGR